MQLTTLVPDVDEELMVAAKIMYSVHRRAIMSHGAKRCALDLTRSVSICLGLSRSVSDCLDQSRSVSICARYTLAHTSSDVSALSVPVQRPDDGKILSASGV